jgi:hypothetical protein
MLPNFAKEDVFTELDLLFFCVAGFQEGTIIELVKTLDEGLNYRIGFDCMEAEEKVYVLTGVLRQRRRWQR